MIKKKNPRKTTKTGIFSEKTNFLRKNNEIRKKDRKRGSQTTEKQENQGKFRKTKKIIDFG
ncbi:MAG: hypothetical protein SPF60_05745 [Lachnospiraceae bacterium]|nr:hypothetical protein [Oscillospiraceae bacterium]MDY5540908.1 hypothetical protein [Lachnospiraceae bacterium]